MAVGNISLARWTGWITLLRQALVVSWWVWLFPAALAAALIARSLVFLDYVHILCAILWTGSDLFLGFVLGPILRRLEASVRRQVVGQLMPRMLFYMPVISGTTTVGGWYLAHRLGIWSVPMFHPWLVAALVLALLMMVQGGSLLLLVDLLVYREVQKEHPDASLVRRLMLLYMRLLAGQGVLQLAIVFVMVHFAI